MKTVWNYSPETEAYRIIFMANDIASGFFRANNFPLVPYGYAHKSNCYITFPELPYSRIPHFWSRIKQYRDEPWPGTIRNRLIDEVSALLGDRFPPPDMDKLKALWKKAQVPVLREICRLLPQYKNAVSGIEIYPTHFGSTCSFSISHRFPATIKIYLREDQGIHEIVEAILTSLTRNYVFTGLNGSWSESELLVDYLVDQSSLSLILKRYQPERIFHPTLKKIRSVQKGDIVKTSRAFYGKLGFPENPIVFEAGGSTPTVNSKPLTGLTDREAEVLRALINNRGKILSYDQLEKLIFSDEESFSLYVIAKVMQNLRDKLEKNGVSGCYIQTVRKKGFLIN